MVTVRPSFPPPASFLQDSLVGPPLSSQQQAHASTPPALTGQASCPPACAMCSALCGTLRRITFWFSTAVTQLTHLSLTPFPSLSHFPASVLAFLGPLPNKLLALSCLTQAVLLGKPKGSHLPAYLPALSLLTLHVATRVASDNVHQSRSPALLKTSQWLLLTSRKKR